MNIYQITIALLLMSGVLIGSTQGQSSEKKPGKDLSVFEGQITNKDLKVRKLFGEIVYDRNCKAIENNLTNCDAGVKVEGIGVLNFNYSHEMASKSCLVPDQKVLLKIVSAQKAYVVR